MFLCDRCGACCRHLNFSPIYKELDRGDGVCKYLSGNLCSIYENRPLFCRVDECYPFFAEQMTREEYDRMNSAACEQLKKMEKEEEKWLSPKFHVIAEKAP